MSRITVDAFSSLVAEIGKAALEPARWPKVLEQIHVLSGGARIHLVGHEFRETANAHVYVGGYDPQMIADYVDHYCTVNPWLPVFSMLPVGRPTLARAMYSQNKLEKTEFYSDWLRPQGDIVGGGGTVLFRDASRFFVFGGNIARSDCDRLEQGWMDFLGLVTQHLQQALEINRTLAERRLEADAAALSIDATKAAVIALGSDGVLLYANPAAQARLAQRKTLRQDAGKLTLAESGANDRLQQELLALRVSRPGPPLVVELPTPEGPLLCRTVRIQAECCTANYLAFVTGEGMPMLLLVLEPKEKAPLRPCPLNALGMTPGETRVVQMLAQGRTPAQIAELREVSVHTVRNQIKSAMGKAEVSRQSALVAVVLRAQAET